MKQRSVNSLVLQVRICVIVFILALASLFLFSFTVKRIADDFLVQLGITKTAADEKITNSVLGGYLDAYGLKNAKKIAAGDRVGIAKDLWAYTKKYVNSPSFVKEYKTLKEGEKPVKTEIQTPEDLRKSMIEMTRKSVAETEENLKKADATMKPIFEKVLAEGKKQLREAEDPDNKQFAGYAKGYPEMVKMNEAHYEKQLTDWEEKYPSNHLLFVKKRLQQFLDETSDVDFSAALTEKDGKKIFVDSKYERKSNRWKMAYRAGKDVVEVSRTFVSQWIADIQ